MKIIKSLNLEKCLFIDIETVSSQPTIVEGTRIYDAWLQKINNSWDELGGVGLGGPQQSYLAKSPLYGEFAKIACITIGMIKGGKLKLQSYTGYDEVELLSKFVKAINAVFAADKGTIICGHTIKGFVIPMLVKRLIIAGIDIPGAIDIGGLKPWEINMPDTNELWKGSGFAGASLAAMTMALDIPQEFQIKGKNIVEIYWNVPDVGLIEISQHCETKVEGVVNIFRKIRGEELFVAEVGELKFKRVGTLDRVYNSGVFGGQEKKEILEVYKHLEGDDKKKADEILKIVLPK